MFACQGENILQVELDMPNRTTRDYEGPSVAPKIQAVLDAALEDEGDIDIEDRSAVYAVLCQYFRVVTDNVVMKNLT